MRHGAALQGDLEGKPGRDPEVHHQGANHALRWLFLAALAACGCGPSSQGTRAAGPDETPSEGTILYHEPERQQGVIKRRTAPVTQLVTTATDEALAEEGPYRTYSGTVAGVEKGQTISSKEWERAVGRLLQTTGKANTRVLRRERFQALWRQLEDAGLFRLPLHRGPERPGDEPHFILKTRDREWIFTRPAYVDTPDRNDPQVEQLRIWNTVKLAFFDFLNQPE